MTLNYTALQQLFSKVLFVGVETKRLSCWPACNLTTGSPEDRDTQVDSIKNEGNWIDLMAIETPRLVATTQRGVGQTV